MWNGFMKDRVIIAKIQGSHDYDSLDWFKVKQLCEKMISDRTEKLLNECFLIAEAEESEMKDYTVY